MPHEKFRAICSAVDKVGDWVLSWIDVVMIQPFWEMKIYVRLCMRWSNLTVGEDGWMEVMCVWVHTCVYPPSPSTKNNHNQPPPPPSDPHKQQQQQLDKEPWEEVRREMTEEKGLQESVADRIGTFVTYKGPPQELHAKVNNGAGLMCRLVCGISQTVLTPSIH